MYGLGVGISTVLEIFEHFLFKGDGTTDIPTIMIHGRRIYTVLG
jgi:hypothetical protein